MVVVIGASFATVSAQVPVSVWCTCLGRYVPPGQCNCDEPSPPPPPPVRFPRIEGLSRCNGLEFDVDLNDLRQISKQLRDDAFAAAFGVFRRDIDAVAQELQDLETRVRRFDQGPCRSYNTNLREFDMSRSEWNDSQCVTGVPADGAPGCRAQESDLLSWRQRLQRRRESVAGEEAPTVDEFHKLATRAKAAISNAQNVLNPVYSEQAHRLYIWHVLKEQGQPPLNSCRAFAQIATTLGRRVDDKDLFIDYLVRNLIEPRRDVSFFAGDAPGRPMAGSMFDASGFKRKYCKNLSENQVRHAAAYLLSGYKFDGTTAAEVQSYVRDVILPREPEREDFALAVAAAQLGVRLRRGIHSTSTETFGDAIAREFCD